MVAQHYRWDFVGLSTDERPTPATSEKVVDGSTYYCSDTSKLYVWCKNSWYERKALGDGGGGTTYTAGDGIDITDSTISVDTDTIQPKLTAGENITITDNVISASGGGGGDTVYSTKTTSNSDAGGAVYIGNLNSSQEEQVDPTTTDNHYRYFYALPISNSDSTWNNAVNILGSINNYGTDSISILGSGSSQYSVGIGKDAYAEGYNSVAIGRSSHTINNSVAIGKDTLSQQYSIAIGESSGQKSNSGLVSCVSLGYKSGYSQPANTSFSVNLGAFSKATRQGEVNIGMVSGETTSGYNNTAYRVIGGVHDGVDAHDAVTVEQINNLIDAINTATGSNISHIGS